MAAACMRQSEARKVEGLGDIEISSSSDSLTDSSRSQSEPHVIAHGNKADGWKNDTQFKASKLQEFVAAFATQIEPDEPRNDVEPRTTANKPTLNHYIEEYERGIQISVPSTSTMKPPRPSRPQTATTAAS